ncbi:MAG TPA: hypothetical protein VFP84_02130 [Kofleriaceae bacterium]|nr:hypothetical protein [Kofleriaceae bacterium]
MAATAGTASAGGAPGTVGVGGEIELSGLGGLSVNYDAGRFHVGGFIGLNDPNGPSNTSIEVGGRFFYHVASTATADFSLGGGLGIRNIGDQAVGIPDNGSQTDVYLEPSFQIRAFILPNVALSFTGGISIGVGDDKTVTLTSDLVGTAGVHYYF